MDARTFQKIKDDISEAKSRKDRLSGALEALKDRMKKEFECDSIKELEEKLASTLSQCDKLQTKYDANVQELETMVQEIV